MIGMKSTPVRKAVLLLRKGYEGCELCCMYDTCGIYDECMLLDTLMDKCDRALELAVERGRREYRDAWYEYISEYSDY